MTELDIQDKIDELKKDCVNDSHYLIDALTDCLDEIRQLLNAVGQDDKLNAIDALKDAINERIVNETDIRNEAIAILNNEEYDNDNDNDNDNDSFSAMDDAGHKESDFR